MRYGIDVDQLRSHVVLPVLQILQLDSPAARVLVLGTALQESHATYLRQIKGPALGLWQMEPATHADIHRNYLAYQPSLRALVRRFAGYYNFGTGIPQPEEMIGNLFYACAMCRVHYRRFQEALPHAKDAQAMASYWKRFYNGPGKGTVIQAIPHFHQAIVMEGI